MSDRKSDNRKQAAKGEKGKGRICPCRAKDEYFKHKKRKKIAGILSSSSTGVFYCALRIDKQHVPAKI